MKKVLFTLMITLACLLAWADNSVTVTYNGNTATVTVDDNVAQYLTVTQSGAHVSITQSSAVAQEITYTLTGTSSNGEFYMSGSYKATIELNGLTLTNSTPVYSGAAVHIQNGKRINVKVITGTTNTLTDAASGSQKGCLYVKGHAEFKQQGTLNVVGNKSHAIKAGEYISVKNATINVTSAVDDGISCNQYFLMESGSINISGTGDDGIQCDLDGDTSTGMTVNHEDEDSGNFYVSGGSITINSNAIAAKGIKCQGDAYISGNAVIDVTTTGKGEWDTTDQETNAACGLSSDGDINISGGTLTLKATGSGGKGMKCDNVLNISGGNITVSTTGGLYYNNGNGTENTNYTANTDWVDNKYYSAAKGIKAGYKDESGNNTICYGGINISGGTIYVTTTGRNAEGIESKNYLNVTGGETTIDAYDDGINAAQDLYITDGYFYSRSSNNDGIDANGNVVIEGGLIYAIGAASPEVAIDANSEENKKFHFNGGVLIAIGGLESGSTLAQTCYQTSSVSSNTWYSMTYGGNVIAFLTPTVSSGGGPGGGPGGGNSSKMVVSAPSTPTLKSGVTVSSGTPVFYGPKGYLDATVTGGSNVSLSQYSSGGGGGSGSYTVTASANPTGAGSVTGAGVYSAHTLCTLTATANAGYTFVNWTRNGSVASTDPTYSFYVTENTTCVANFTQGTYSITATANPTEGGSITGAGRYNEGANVTLKATANAGYTFVNWTEDGTQVSTSLTYNFTVSGDAAFVANFSLNSYEITTTANPTIGGTVSGAGTYNYGASCTLTATANEFYTFVNWTKDGTEVSTESTYNFTVTEAAVFVANFSLDGYEVTATPNPIIGGSVTISGIDSMEPNEFHYDFEDGTTQGWTILQGTESDSPNNWIHNTYYTGGNYSTSHGHNASNGFMLSESFVFANTEDEGTPVHPDNYLVSPQIQLGGSISFWATNADNEFGAEHFAVAVSTSGNSTASDFTTVQEWTMSARRTGGARTIDDGTWYEYTADLSAFMGFGYVAIRHFDCYEQWLVCVDDITIVEGEPFISVGTFVHGETCTVTATANEGYTFVNWTEDGEEVSTESAYSFEVTGERNLVANFVVSQAEQTVELSAGWSWWSTNLDITLDDLKNAIADAVGNTGTATIKTQGGAITYRNGRWRGNGIQSLNIRRMYEIQTSVTCEITLVGTPVNPSEYEITITPDNNWIGFLPSTSMTLSEAFGTFPVNGDVVASKDHSSVYRNGQWRGQLSTLQPGHGYIYQSHATGDKTFTYPTGSK